MARPDSLAPATRLDAALRPAVVPPRLPGPGGEALTWRAGGPGPPPTPRGALRPPGPAASSGPEPPPDGPPPVHDLDEPETEPLAVLVPRPDRAGLLRRLLPVGWRGARLDPGRPAALVLALVAVVAAVLAAVGVWSDRPQVEPVAGLPPVVVDEPRPGADPAAAATDPDAPASGPLVVSVSGRVARPGLVEVPAGARVADALAAAGGALPGTDLTGLNLARKLADGEQVAVGVPPAPDAVGVGTTGPGGSAGSGAPVGKVDLNAATVEQLDVLPGVGPVTAQRILEWRTRHGRFARVEQLREVEGIGERRFEQLRELVTV
jgi:competence protein ComEA